MSVRRGGFIAPWSVRLLTLIGRFSPLSTAAACIKIYILTTSLASADVAEIEVLGFASTGEAIFLQQGRQDGSGFPYAIVSSVSGDNLVEVDSVLIRNSG